MEKNHIFKQSPAVSRYDKETSYRQKGIVYWLTGLSGSGKSTIAAEFERKLHSMGFITLWLDGDNVRSGLCRGLGFSPEDRKENLRRVAEVCKMNAQSGIVIIASFISPLQEDRETVRGILGDDYVEVFVSTPLEVCESRDVKGLYQKARLGEIPNFTGIGAPYHIPSDPTITIDASVMSLESCTSELLLHYSRMVSESGLKRTTQFGDNWPCINHGNGRLNLSDSQHAVFIGRFQPLHIGHEMLFRQKLGSGIPLLILVRDLEPDENNPFTTEQTMGMISKVFEDEAVVVGKIPDIESVNWGRGVGYELNEFFPPEDIKGISATKVRESIANRNDEWMNYISPRIHDDIKSIVRK